MSTIQTELIERLKDGHLVQQYLLASYCYYHLNESPMTDHAFDRLCVRLLERLPVIEHQHKHLVSESDLRMGTCLLNVDKFPSVVKNIADDYMRKIATGEFATGIEPHLHPA